MGPDGGIALDPLDGGLARLDVSEGRSATAASSAI
jgi:hypothetical protein